MQRQGSGLLQQQQQRQPEGGRTAQQRQQQQQEAAAAHARELLQGGADVGRSRLSHPLYVPLYDAGTLQDVLQQQQQQQFISRCSSRPTAYDQSADGRLLEDILNMCPLLTPAATLVETKLSSRALRLDTMQLPRSVGGEGAAAAVAAAANPSSSSSSPAEAAGGRQAKRGRPLKLSRTKAKKLGLFDVRSDFEPPPSSHKSSSSRASVPPTAAAAVRAASLAAASPPANMPYEAAAVVGEETRTTRRPAAGMPEAAAVSPPPGAAGGGGAAAGVCVATVGGKLHYEDMEQLSTMWLQYARRICGTAAAAENAGAAPSESSSRSRGSSSEASQHRQPHHHHHHQPHQKPLHPRQGPRQEGLAQMRLQQKEADEQQQQFFRKAADRCMALSKAAWQGARVCVTRSTSPTLVGLEGVIVEETQHSLLLLCPDQRLRRLLKHTVTLKVQTLDSSNFFVHPKHLQHSSAARSKVKFKPKNSLLL